MKPARLIGSVQRAIDILKAFDKAHPELGMTELARGLNLPKATVAGLVYTLVHNGFLTQNPATRRYRLGYALVERAGVLLSQFDLRQIADPVLQDLRNASNESVNLAVRDGLEVVYIQRLLGASGLGVRAEIGRRERLYTTALGKVLLAWLPAAEQRRLLAGIRWEPITPYTLTNPEAFLADLHATCQRGYALDDEENELGGRCVAAPVFDFDDQPAAAISVSVPLQRLPDCAVPALGAQVCAAARRISQLLGAPEKPQFAALHSQG
jgi:DNA-binding IclR family transcriptional regulator